MSRINYFDHEKLDVYKVSIEFVILSNEIAEQLPRGKAYLADQLQRASSSISLNIAEGAGEFAGNEKCRFYRMAKRSATECAAVLDLCSQLVVVRPMGATVFGLGHARGLGLGFLPPERLQKIVFKWLNRRSQRKSFTWDQFAKYTTTHPLPTVRIVHRLF